MIIWPSVGYVWRKLDRSYTHVYAKELPVMFMASV